jgi:hypothetical protein
MAPATGTALLLLAVFVVPGFVALLLSERAYAVRGPDSPFERLLHALFFSAAIYAAVLVVAAVLGLDKEDISDFYRGHKSLGASLAAGFVIAFAAPAVLALAGLRWHRSGRLRPAVLEKLGIEPGHNVDSGWNEAFSRAGTAMLRATLSDGRVVGGRYGPGSFAGYSQRKQDLFICERWMMDEDGWFVEVARGTRGVWIPRESIVSLEFYDDDWEEGDADADVPAG